MRETPRIGLERTPVVVHLLAPNQRPVQTTTDLAGFWERLYPEIRRELMRRYPKHAWPDQPLVSILRARIFSPSRATSRPPWLAAAISETFPLTPPIPELWG